MLIQPVKGVTHLAMEFTKELAREAFYEYLVRKNISGEDEPRRYWKYKRMARDAVIAIKRDKHSGDYVAVIETALPIDGWELKLFRKDGEVRMGAA